MLLTRSTTTAWLALLSASLASCGGSSEGGSSGSADTMYVNAKVLTVNQDNAVAQAFAVKDGKFISSEGDPDYPVSEGALCPKGAAFHAMHVSHHRILKPK